MSDWKESVNYKHPDYQKLHSWVRYRKGAASKQLCEECGCSVKEHIIDWANVSGKYKKDTNDYRALCRPCHRKFDKRPTRPTCMKGHLLNEENSWIRKRFGHEYPTCRICNKLRKDKYVKSKQSVA